MNEGNNNLKHFRRLLKARKRELAHFGDNNRRAVGMPNEPSLRGKNEGMYRGGERKTPVLVATHDIYPEVVERVTNKSILNLKTRTTASRAFGSRQLHSSAPRCTASQRRQKSRRTALGTRQYSPLRRLPRPGHVTTCGPIRGELYRLHLGASRDDHLRPACHASRHGSSSTAIGMNGVTKRVPGI